MDINEIRNYLPHRYPFLFLDRVTDIELGKSIVAIKNISINEPVFDGHFPGNPIFPGVCIVEAMAQACCVLALKTMGTGVETNKAYVIAGIDKVRFKRSATPGDQVVIRVEVVSRKRTVWKFKAEAKVDGELVGSAELLCAERNLDD
ncbi:MAG: 3-hydroxyacyl-[acyl-carrier-protein] dehydratase FabZ [Moraxellaceae bacterium]|nr:MAG: 3-hydroxyacyl-[acyl-carrier-protein] dehydratase FabZ [Moraxellaceae bacterium]